MRLHAFPAYISRLPFPFGLRGNHFGIRGGHPGLRRYRPILRPIFLVVRFHSFIHSFQYHSVHQIGSSSGLKWISLNTFRVSRKLIRCSSRIIPSYSPQVYHVGWRGHLKEKLQESKIWLTVFWESLTSTCHYSMEKASAHFCASRKRL